MDKIFFQFSFMNCTRLALILKKGLCSLGQYWNITGSVCNLLILTKNTCWLFEFHKPYGMIRLELHYNHSFRWYGIDVIVLSYYSCY